MICITYDMHAHNIWRHMHILYDMSRTRYHKPPGVQELKLVGNMSELRFRLFSNIFLHMGIPM